MINRRYHHEYSVNLFSMPTMDIQQVFGAGR